MGKDWFDREGRLTEALAKNDIVGIITEVRVKASLSEMPMAEDDDYRTFIMRIISHLEKIAPPGLYADFFGPEATSGRLCHWGHTMRKPTAEEHEAIKPHLPHQSILNCSHCDNDFSPSAEWEEGYWHCFDCHRNQEPEYDNHLCDPCGIVESVAALLQNMLPRCNDCGQQAIFEDYSEIPVGGVLTCSTLIETGEVCGSTNFTELKLR